MDASPTGSVYALPEYLEVLCRATGGRYSIRAALRGDEIRGGIPFFREGRGARVEAVPRLLLFYNGPVLRRYTTRYPAETVKRHLAALRALEASVRDEGVGKFVLRARSPLTDVRAFQAGGWTTTSGYTLVTPLGDRDELWGSIDPNARRLVDRAAEQGLTVTEDADFESFFRLHREIHERKGAPLYLPEKAFQAYIEALRGKGLLRLYHARLADGTAASSQIVLTSGHPVTHTAVAASAEEHHGTGASPFLRWKVFEALGEEGFEANDLSGAGTGGVARFKMQLGSELQACMEASMRSAAYRWAGMPRRLSRPLRRSAKRMLRPVLRRMGRP